MVPTIVSTAAILAGTGIVLRALAAARQRRAPALIPVRVRDNQSRR
jgi:hypothetical protein